MLTLRLLLLASLALYAQAAEAKLLAWEGTLSLDLLDPGLEGPVLAGPGVALALPTEAGGKALQTLHLVGGLDASAFVLVTDPGAPALAALSASATLGIGTLGPFQPPVWFGPQLTRRTLPVLGALRLCFFSITCGGALSVPLAINAGRSGTGVGVGGHLTVGGMGPIRISLEAAPWTLGTTYLSVTTPSGASLALSRFGFVHGPASLTGSTATSGGELQLVTPLVVRSTQTPELSGFGVLTVRFIPEPGSLLLLGSAGAALAVLGRRRFRS